MKPKRFLSSLMRLLANQLRPYLAAEHSAAQAPADSPDAPPSSLPIPPQDSRIQPLCDALRRQGRLLPAWEAMGIRAFMEHLAAHADDSFDGLAWFQQFLEALPPIIALDEAAPDQPAAPSAAPLQPGGRIDGPSMARHRRALQALAHGGITYSEALRRVS